jgi:hypothetical protein
MFARSLTYGRLCGETAAIRTCSDTLHTHTQYVTYCFSSDAAFRTHHSSHKFQVTIPLVPSAR